MQYAYQFPERTERLALVAPGGLGPEVSVFIGALTLPGASAALSVAGLPPFRPFIARGPARGRAGPATAGAGR